MSFFNNDDYKNEYDYYEEDKNLSYNGYDDRGNWSAGEAIMFVATLYFLMQIFEMIFLAIIYVVMFVVRVFIRVVKFIYGKGKEWFLRYREKRKLKNEKFI